ncbi:hypothetical protein TSAR_003560 [Trichomalopsis sarcophagae]|uniref:Uncharacterized protein n=1 Tax=Trichomalopsis sarcophagae TaxID=543379 RepID=A0A232FEP1_9HYME|nr:hypothetical protein TSAR_003560 [Trichomalopsis sarcophagae]
MFPRCFIYFGMIALFVAVASIGAEETDDTEVQDRANPAVKAVAKILGSVFASAAAGCLTEAATACKSHWKNPKKALKCGKDWLARNKGRCAVGK